MAYDLVKVLDLQPFERPTTILSGQQYPMLSLLLPVITGLQKGLSYTLPQECSRAIKNFQAHLTPHSLGRSLMSHRRRVQLWRQLWILAFAASCFSKPRKGRHN